jgi:hypothetical protein
MRITEVRTVQLTRRLERPERNAREARGERTFTFVMVEEEHLEYTRGLRVLAELYRSAGDLKRPRR